MFTIYNASAGSGKTYTLAVQYIARLLASSMEVAGAYRQVLAVTFTNKATAEMKDRILQQLYGIGFGLHSSGSYLRSVQAALGKMHVEMDDDEIRTRSREVLHDILHDYTRFRVETIDSFFRSILTEMARELGLPAGLRADIDQRACINEAVNRIIDQLDQHDDVRRWVTGYIREQMREGDRWDVTSIIKDFAFHLFDQPYLENQEVLNAFLTDDEAVNAMRGKLDEAREHINAGIEEAIANLEAAAPGHTTLGDGTVVGDYSRFNKRGYIESHVARLRQVKNGKPMPEITNTLYKWSVDGTAMLNKDHDPCDEPLAREVGERLDEMFTFERYANTMLNTINLTRQNLNPMRLLGTVGRTVNDVTQEKGTFLLANTPILLHRMVRGSDASFIYERTGSLLRHIMLDEFQDTSTLQWQNFQTLIDDNMAKGGSTLVVGDVKQSIYRWRGGDCNILANLPAQMARYNPRHVPLSTNHRSTRHIILFNNALYKSITKQVNLMRDDSETWSINPIYAEAEQKVPESRGETGHVSLTHYHSAKPKEAHEMALNEMCAAIRRMIDGGHQPQDMVILIRSSREMAMVANAFANQLPDVPLVSDDVFCLNQSSAVNIVVNALRVILHPDDTASLGRLVFLYNSEVRHNTDVNSLFDDIDRKRPFTTACAHLPKAFANIGQLRQLPLLELIMQLCDMFGVDSIEGQSAYTMTFLDAVASSMHDTSGNLTTLLHYWDESLAARSIPGGEVKGVNIMTIHRAKGLQWRTVLIPFCDWKIHDDFHLGSIFWSSPHDNRMLCGLPTVAVPMVKAAADSIFANDYRRELQNQRVDNLNLLYVATTRAKDNLLAWGCGKEPKNAVEIPNRTMMQMIMATVDELPQAQTTDDDDTKRYTYGDIIINHEADRQETTHDNRLEVDYTTTSVTRTAFTGRLSFRQSNEASKWTGMTDEAAPTPQQTTYINRGTVLHSIFSNIATLDDIDHAIASLPSEITTAIDGKDLRHTALRLLERGCSNEVVRSWFSGKYKVNNEYTIIAPDNETGHAREHRPDRVMSCDDKLIVVDFKFGQQHDDHKRQVERYKQLLAAMQPDKHVEGYLWYVYSNEIVKV